MAGKKARAKVRGNKNVYDEWEHADIDRDEQSAGLKRRDKRWKEILIEQQKQRNLEKKALEDVGYQNRGYKGRPPTELETAWLRCDFILANIMDRKSYQFMEWQRVHDTDAYKRLYRHFVSKNMLQNMQQYVDYFAQGYKAPRLIPFPEVIKYYKKIKGIKSKMKVFHKGEDEYDL